MRRSGWGRNKEPVITLEERGKLILLILATDKQTVMPSTSLPNGSQQMARFHLLVDLGLRGNLQPSGEAELAALRRTLGQRDATATAKLLKQMTKEQTQFDKSMARIRTQVAALRVDLANAPNHPKAKSAGAQ